MKVGVRRGPSCSSRHKAKKAKLIDILDKCTSHNRKWDMVDYLGEDESPVMRLANEVLANLGPGAPAFVKLMRPSNVSGCFWLGLSKKFCDMHMPKHDAAVFLEDDSGEEFQTKYLVEKNGLRGGWRAFSTAHNLLPGDALVFRLVKPIILKVYIVRANDSSQIHAALGLLYLHACANRAHHGNCCIEPHEKADIVTCCEPRPLEFPQQKETIPKDIPTISALSGNVYDEPITDHSENESESHGSELLDGIRLLESPLEFEEVKSIDDFTIYINGVVIDAVFPKHLRIKYYELCRSQKSYLHKNLIEGLHWKLAAGIISEIISISDAIKASEFTVSTGKHQIWDKTLKAFEELGMNVAFLRARLERLPHHTCKSRSMSKTRGTRS